MIKKLKNIYIGFDYGVLLPFFALFSYKIGRALASLRGKIYFYLRRDWRSFTFGDQEIFERTLRSYRLITPNLSEKEYLKMVQQRYINQSIEEYEAILLAKGKFPSIPVVYEGDKEVQEYLNNNPHCVFITAHFGNSLAGVSFLETFGVPVLGMSSNVTKKQEVHPSITKLYNNKYSSIATKLNGGNVIDVEGNGKKFLKFLKQDGSLIIIADLPPTSHNETPLFKNFFGASRGFASGASKMSQGIQGEIIAFVSYYENGCYVMKFGDLEDDPYQFLENEIQQRPTFWWASDLLELYPTKESAE